MKTIFSAFVVLSIIYCFAQMSNAAAPCGNVDMKAAACIAYVTGKAPSPAGPCCTNLQALAKTVKTVNDKKAICQCLKDGVKKFTGVQDSLLGKIPAMCKINVGFPVSLNTNCDK